MSVNDAISTAICFITDDWGKLHPVKTLLDGQSTSRFLIEECVNKLKLRTEKVNIVITRLNNSLFTIQA